MFWKIFIVYIYSLNYKFNYYEKNLVKALAYFSTQFTGQTINLNMRVTTSETSPLVLRNIEALAGDESGEDPFPCTVAGGMCYYLGEPYFGISLI